MHGESSYGLWSLVIINSAIFIFFAFSFFKPKTKTDRRRLTAFSAFIVALFTKMYAFPLTIYFLSEWLAPRYTETDFLQHNNGQLPHTFLAVGGNPHFDVMQLASIVLIFLGFVVLSSAWSVLNRAKSSRELATEGWYARYRHPQYLAFIPIMFAFLLQWPTIPTVIMFPLLLWIYARLATSEEKIAIEEFGDAFHRSQQYTPAWIPRWKTQPFQQKLQSGERS